ncbi:MAG: tetratricopeptide repeat protein [Elusimicrobiaceae bacterium]|nr:tetratricopeptide repeat protein [Elusimicrobiaceae bacterium]
MKHLFCLLGLLCATGVWGLELSEQGRREAEVFNSFLQAIYLPASSQQTFAGLEKTLALEPDSKYVRRLLVSLALAAGNPEQAKPYIGFIDEGENDAQDWEVYAAYEWQAGQVATARQAYEKALALNPDDSKILYQYILLLASLPLEEAVPALEQLVPAHVSEAANIYTTIGRLYAQRLQFEQALSYLQKAVEAAPDDPSPRLVRAEIYEKNSQLFLLLHELEELEKMGYANAGTLSRMGAVFLLSKDVPRAQAYFLKAKADDNTDATSNYFLALLAEQRGDLEGAIGYLKDSAEYPTKSSLRVQVSFYENRLNRPHDTLRTLGQAYRDFPGNVEVAFFYGLALNDNGNHRQAARVFKQILSTNPDYPEARLNYAYALESLHRYRDMEFQLAWLLDRQPRNAAALNLYAYSLAERNQRLDEAQGYIVRALAVSPQDYSFIDTLGWVLIRQGKLAQAQDVLLVLPREIIEQNAEIAYHLGVLYHEQGDTQKALKYLEMAQDKWPAAKKLYKKLRRK